MIDFYNDKICIEKHTLNHNDKVLCINISEYNDHNQIVSPFIAIVKISDIGELFFDCDEDNSCLYSDNDRYIVIKVLK